MKEVGQTPLAYLTAATHGYEEEADKLKEDLAAKGQPVPIVDSEAKLLVAPKPIQQMKENWPQLRVSTSALENQIAKLSLGYFLHMLKTFIIVLLSLIKMLFR